MDAVSASQILGLLDTEGVEAPTVEQVIVNRLAILGSTPNQPIDELLQIMVSTA